MSPISQTDDIFFAGEVITAHRRWMNLIQYAASNLLYDNIALARKRGLETIATTQQFLGPSGVPETPEQEHYVPQLQYVLRAISSLTHDIETMHRQVDTHLQEKTKISVPILESRYGFLAADSYRRTMNEGRTRLTNALRTLDDIIVTVEKTAAALNGWNDEE